MFEEGHLHKCEACDDYYRHDDYKCNKYTKWGKCKKHTQSESNKISLEKHKATAAMFNLDGNRE